MNRKPYPNYFVTSIPWLGKIPSHWRFLKIKRLTIIKRGASPRPIDDTKYFDDEGEYAWVRIADITSSERYLVSTKQKLSTLGKNLSVIREPGDIFLSIAATVGKPIITKIKCCIHDGFVYFPYLKENTEFFYYIFSSGQPYLGLGKLGTQLNLNTDTVGDISIGLPTPKEQDSIVSFLDHKIAKIDALIDKKQALLKLLEEKHVTLINKAVTKGLNPEVKMKFSGIEWLGDIPVHWQVRRLKFLAKCQFSNVNKKTEDNETDVFLCNYTDVYKNNIINSKLDFMKATATAREIEKFILQKGDILITKDSESPNDIAVPAFVTEEFDNVLCGYHLAQIKPGPSILPEYMFRLFQAKKFNAQFQVSANGVTRFGLSTDAFNNAIIPVIPLNEQQEIVEYIRINCSKIDTIFCSIKQAIEKLTEYRSAIITAAVTGKIDVRNFKPETI